MDGVEALSFPNQELLLDAKNGIEQFNIQEHSSKEDGVNELRRVYDEQEDRRKSVESKTSAIIAVNGIILGLINVANIGKIYTFLNFTAILFFALSTLCCIWNLWPRGYQQPLSLKEYPTYTKKSKDEYFTVLYKRYFAAISFNSEQNDVRYHWYLISISCTALGILAIGIASSLLLL